MKRKARGYAWSEISRSGERIKFRRRNFEGDYRGGERASAKDTLTSDDNGDEILWNGKFDKFPYSRQPPAAGTFERAIFNQSVYIVLCIATVLVRASFFFLE